MLFFKRILKEPAPPPVAAGKVPAVERRRMRRYVVNPQFPLKAVLSSSGRGDTASPTGQPKPTWKWEGRLINCSTAGARIQMSPANKVGARDLCSLRLMVEEFQLTIPCHISNITEEKEGVVFGLVHDITEEGTRKAYGQLLEVLALGSTLKLQIKSSEPDATGYLVEHYSSDRPARLTVWRLPAGGGVVAFEFLLKDSLVRVVAGQEVEYRDASDGRKAPPARALEIKRLFHWVVPNVAESVPEEVRRILKHHAAGDQEKAPA
jgi:hypothetical protein